MFIVLCFVTDTCLQKYLHDLLSINIHDCLHGETFKNIKQNFVIVEHYQQLHAKGPFDPRDFKGGVSQSYYSD